MESISHHQTTKNDKFIVGFSSHNSNLLPQGSIHHHNITLHVVHYKRHHNTFNIKSMNTIKPLLQNMPNNDTTNNTAIML